MSDVTSEVLFRTEPLAKGGHVGVVTLNAEKTLNSLTLNMVDLLYRQLTQWQTDPDIAFVWFEGAGSKAFCAGGDIQALYQDMVAHPGGPCPYCEDFFSREYRLDYLIHTFDKPTIVWAHGIVMGGGLGVASGCDFKIGTEKTRIAMPEITIGLIPDAGATWSFMQMPTEFAHFLALTGAQINGQDAKHVGLVDFLQANDAKQSVFDALLAQVDASENALVDSIQSVLHALPEPKDLPPSQLVEHQALIFQTMEKALASDNPVMSLLASKELFATNPWLAKAIETLANGAPTTAQIIVEQFVRAGSANKMSLKEMLMQELTLASQCSRHPDFAEGVRALLIDKDGTPNWRQPDMGGVPQEWIEAHFVDPWSIHPLNDL